MSAFSHFVHLPTGHVVLENPFDPKLAPRPIVAHYTKPMNGLAPIDQPSCLHLYRDYLPRPFPSSLLESPFVVLNRRPHCLALDIFPNWTEAQYREALSFGLLGPQPFNITQDPQPFQVFSQEWGWPHRGVLLSLVGLEIIRQTQAQPSVLLFADPFGEWLFYLTQARTWYSGPWPLRLVLLQGSGQDQILNCFEGLAPEHDEDYAPLVRLCAQRLTEINGTAIRMESSQPINALIERLQRSQFIEEDEHVILLGHNEVSSKP